MKIIVATGNKDKVREIKSIFNKTEDEVLSMKEAGITTDSCFILFIHFSF